MKAYTDTAGAGRSCFCQLVRNMPAGPEIRGLEFAWPGPAPRGGQFFLVKPKRSAVFLGRPLSVAAWIPVSPEAAETGEASGGTVRFLLAVRGRGTGELALLGAGEEAELTGPLGNAWGDFLSPLGDFLSPGGERVALIGGGIGIAPLLAFAGELPPRGFDFYAGFRTLRGAEELSGLLGPIPALARELFIATEDGSAGRRGLVPGLLDPARYAAVYACGPPPMLRAVAALAKQGGVPCFVSLERHMACGVGACLGCTVQTRRGNRRCCADGPIFNGEDLDFDE